MLTPLVKKLRVNNPSANIKFICPDAYTSLFQRNNYNVDVIGFSLYSAKSILKLIVKYRNYDLALIAGDNRWSWLALAMGARKINAFSVEKKNWRDWPVDLFINFPLKLESWGDISTRLSNTPNNDCSIKYETNDFIFEPPHFLSANTRKYAILHIGASKHHKLLHPRVWGSISEALRSAGLRIVWTTGKSEKELINGIETRHNDLFFLGSLSLEEMASLLKNATLLVCPDTGIAHLARLTNTPSVVVFGPGTPEIFGPGEFWSQSPFYPIWISNISCRDQQYLFGRKLSWVKQCWKGNSECLVNHCIQDIPTEWILSEIKKVIKCVLEC